MKNTGDYKPDDYNSYFAIFSLRVINLTVLNG